MVTYPAFEDIEVTRENRLLIVKLNRPQRLNAVTDAMHEGLASLWYLVADDPSVGCILLTGAGRAFCAGADFGNLKVRYKEGDQDPKPTIRSIVYSKRLVALMLEVEQPIIGAINGDAIGLGATLAFGCDIIVANQAARFADPHVKNIAVPAGDGGAVLWPLMMGIHRAKEYLLTGAFLQAEEAARLGYINYAVPDNEVMPKALELGRSISEGPQWALRWTKTTVNKIMRERLNLMLDTGLLAERACFLTEDHQEAVDAFLEKREARFKGR